MSNTICKTCQNLVIRTNSGVCVNCYKDYENIRDYVISYPGTIIMNIANNTGVSASRIIGFARNGFFTVIDNVVK